MNGLSWLKKAEIKNYEADIPPKLVWWCITESTKMPPPEQGLKKS
jgi:hypothetical protein